MTDQTIPADDLRGFIARYRTATNGQGSILLDKLEALLPPPPRPTLADMPEEERAACQWMQADVKDRGGHYVIANPDDGEDDAGLVSAYGGIEWIFPEYVTPRPDLPRLEWPNTDQDGEEVTKVDYVPVAGGRTAYGPWTVARLRKKADTVPALPDGWRLADHKENGRVIVTNTTPNRDGYVCYVLPADDYALGYDWLLCKPYELTYLDTEPDAGAVPPNTLAAGSMWIDSGALAQACEESGRDQIVVLDRAGGAYVWSEAEQSWESVSPMSMNGPFTIIHDGKKAHQ